MAETLSIFGFIISVAAFLLYTWKMRQPNPATWALWAALAILNAASYIVLSQSVIQSLQLLAGSVLNTVVAVVALFRGTYQPLNKKDGIPAVLAILAACAWALSGQAQYASYLMGAAFVVGMIPTFRSVRDQPESEPLHPWILFTISYACSVTSVFITDGVGPKSYIYFVGFAAHAALAIWILQNQRSRPHS